KLPGEVRLPPQSPAKIRRCSDGSRFKNEFVMFVSARRNRKLDFIPFAIRWIQCGIDCFLQHLAAIHRNNEFATACLRLVPGFSLNCDRGCKLARGSGGQLEPQPRRWVEVNASAE